MSDTATSVPEPRQSESGVLPDETRAPVSRTTSPTLSAGSGVAVQTQGSLALKQAIDIDRLYEVSYGESSNMVRALELLKEASDYLSEARRSENPIEADRFVQRAQLTLPRLFALRSISDGFGLLVNALYYASVNLRGTPMTRNQLDIVWRTLRELRTHPVISVEQAVQRVEELEDGGLEPDPPELGDLLEDFESAEDA